MHDNNIKSNQKLKIGSSSLSPIDLFQLLNLMCIKRLPVHFIMSKFTSWEAHFPNTESNENFHNYEGNENYSIQSTSSHLYISHCAFSNVTESTIRYFRNIIDSPADSRMLVEFCSFSTCSSISYGGAIYFGAYGQCVLSSLCGIKCATDTNYHGQFCYIQVANEEHSLNYIIDSSVTLTKQTKAHATLEHLCGNISCNEVNVSNNEIKQASGLAILSASKSSISFCSFRNNNSTDYSCIIYYSSIHNITNTNIIENNQETSTSGIFFNKSSDINNETLQRSS